MTVKDQKHTEPLKPRISQNPPEDEFKKMV